MKKIVIIASLLLISFSCTLFAQSTFQKILSNPDDQIINCVTEDDEGNFILVGRKHSDEKSITHGYLIRLNPMGEVLNEIVFENTPSSSQFFNVYFVNEGYLLLGSVLFDYPLSTRLWYLKLDKNLVKIEEKFSGIPSSRWFSYMNSIIDSDSNFVLTGYTSRFDTVSPYNNDPFYYKLSFDGDSLISKFDTSTSIWQLAFDLIESYDYTKYLVFVSHFNPSSSGQILTLDKNFDILTMDSIPLRIYDFYSPIRLNNSEILICGKRYREQPNEEYALNVMSITNSFDIVDFNVFKKELYLEQPAMYNGVSKNEDNIYVGGTSNFDIYDPFFSSFESWFHLVKINSDITPIWEYWYGGDAYYHLYSILATDDGGCLMVGNRYDDLTQNLERDIYVVKVNTDGLIVWTQEISVDNIHTLVYPNPGSNQVNIKTYNKELNFELINISGKMLIKQQVKGADNSINTEQLSLGMYFYRLIDQDNNVIETGKWIKK